jgi:hypothetical protein
VNDWASAIRFEGGWGWGRAQPRHHRFSSALGKHHRES